MAYKVLFEAGQPIVVDKIQQSIRNFSTSYDRMVRFIIENSNVIDETVFKRNVIKLLINFKMTRRGVFQGIDMTDGELIVDPDNVIKKCWNATHDALIEAKGLLQAQNIPLKTRILLLLPQNVREHIINLLWTSLKNLLLITMTDNSYGLVGASKILFAVFPEIALPVDNTEWKQLFKTVDYGDVLKLMTHEIMEWENATGRKLDECDARQPTLTLPAIYNVMAMEARP
jgi:hypothetical protein